MKILVTGGGGFIGSFLVSELEKEGHKVSNLSLDEGADIRADITDRGKMMEVIPDFDQVYHLAGMLGTSELIDKAYEASRVNILGTVNILDACRVNNTKMIEITKPNCWLNTYSITKFAAESFTKMYKEQFGLPTVSIKWFNVYGPNQSFHCQKAVPFFIDWALKGQDIQIWGDGEQTMDLIHAEDSVLASIEIAKHKDLEGTTVDVGSGEETSVNYLADLVLNLTGSKSKKVYLPMRAGEDPNTKLCADLTVLNKTDFKFKRQLEEGMAETVRWYQSQLA